MKDALNNHLPQDHSQRLSAVPLPVYTVNTGRPRRDNEDDRDLKKTIQNPPSPERKHQVLVQKKVMLKSYWDLKSESR